MLYEQVVFMPLRPEPMRHIGKEIRRQREARGWSQERLAEAAGPEWDQSRVSQIETGKNRNPSLDKLLDLAAALDTTVDTFFAAFAARDLTAVPNGAALSDAQVASDLLAFASARPDILDTMARLRERNTAETYARALRRIHRHIISEVELAAEESTPSSRQPTRLR